MAIFRKLNWFFKDEKKSYSIAVIALVLVAILQTVPPRVIGIVIDGIDNAQMTIRFISQWAIVLIVVAVSQYLLRYVWRKRIWGNAAKLEQLLRMRLFRHFTEMDHVFFQTHRTGDLMAHATNDLMAVQNVAGGGILTMADSIITGGSTIIAMVLFVDWRLTIIALIPLPFLAIASRKLGDLIHAAFIESQASFSRVNDKTQESITGIKVIKTFGQEKEDIADFQGQIDDSTIKNKRVNFIEALFDPVITFIVGISYVLTILFGGYLVMNHSITVGQLITFISYISMLIWPMYAMGHLFNILERGNASYDRVSILLEEKSSILERSDGSTRPAIGNLDAHIESFSYPDSDTVALHNIMFNLKKGNTLGIAGKTGAGKTTLIKLILREYDNYKGDILFGNENIKDYSLDALLSSIGYVPQDHFLFSMTVMDNIRFGKPTATIEEVEDAAKMANIHEDILNFSEGYNTMVGERGVSLSGGQKQRISIARALLVNPELLILDDALSAVDAKTEEKILSNLKEKRYNKTTMIVAHRLSSLMHAEEIIVISDGNITERGTHDTLVKQDGWYQSIFDAQQLEAKLEESEVTD